MQGGKKAKHVRRVFFTAKMGAKKNCFDEIYDICFLNICEKHPLIGENCIQSLKNMDFAHFHSFYKGSLRQKSLKQKVKVIFSFKVVKKLEILNVTPPIETLPQCIVDFCLHLKTRYNVKVALMEAVLGNSLCLTSEIFTQFTNYS